MKLLFVVLDGMADRPLAALDGKTPLEAANAKAMDSLAARGSCGLLSVIPDVAPESDSAVLALLGYDPYKCYTGRGPLEAAGLGVNFKPGMLALRCNFATSSDGINIIDRRAGRTLTSREAAALAAVINKKVKLSGARFRFYASVAHRGVLVISDTKRKLSPAITNVDPAYEIRNGIPFALSGFEMKAIKSSPLDSSPAAKRAAELVNEFTQKSFEAMRKSPVNSRRKKKGLLPANIILSRDAGTRLPDLYNLSRKHGKKWAILADMPLEIGIGKLAGMEIIRLPLPTFTAVDFAVRVEKVVAAMKKFDCLYVHIKGPDLFGHDGDFRGKTKSIANIDKYFFSPLLKQVDLKSTVIVVTADHTTACDAKGHTEDPVPFVVCGGSVKADFVERFGESYCRNGGFGTLKGKEFMDKLITETFK